MNTLIKFLALLIFTGTVVIGAFVYQKKSTEKEAVAAYSDKMNQALKDRDESFKKERSRMIAVKSNAIVELQKPSKPIEFK